jgi:hypothetical protein
VVAPSLVRVYEKFGITADNLAAKALEVLAFYQGKPVPSLIDVPIISDYSAHHPVPTSHA